MADTQNPKKRPILSEALDPLLQLAKVRELLLIDRDDWMPTAPTVKEQRSELLEGIEHIISQALLSCEALPDNPAIELDPLSADAFKYLKTTKSQDALPDAPLPTAYENLERAFQQRTYLDQANEIVGWIDDTRLKPKEANEKRIGYDDETALGKATSDTLSEGMGATRQFMVRVIASPIVKQWLTSAEKEAKNGRLNSDQMRNLGLMKNIWTTEVGIGEDIIKNFALASSDSLQAWGKEKGKTDKGKYPEKAEFKAWLPSFEDMIAKLRIKADALEEKTGVPAYEALMLERNPGLSKATVDRILNRELGAILPNMAKEIIDKQSHEEPPKTLPPIELEDQMVVVRHLMERMGLDPAHFRADAPPSAHPCSYMPYNEQRITVRGSEQDLLNRLLAAIHETGHELYAKNIPQELATKNQPIGNTQSMWMHETQSLFWEREVAYTKPFMRFLSNFIRKELSEERFKGKYDEALKDSAWDAENLYKTVMKVLPSNTRRVDADDVTYPLHIIIRHELAQKLVEGTLAPDKLPSEWNKLYKQKLGITVKNDYDGCMQDMQMPLGNFAGFPGYTFGRLGAAMLGKAARKEMGEDKLRDYQAMSFDERIERGNFEPIAKWLTKKIHLDGSRYDGVRLIENATRIRFSAQPYLDEMRERYGLERKLSGFTK